MVIVSSDTHNKEFNYIVMVPYANNAIMAMKSRVDGFVKFLINDFKSVQNKFEDAYDRIDAKKLVVLYMLYKDHYYFTRQELVEFLESELC